MGSPVLRNSTFSALAELELRQELTVKATADDGKTTEFNVICRIDTPAELDYYRHGGILNTCCGSYCRIDQRRMKAEG